MKKSIVLAAVVFGFGFTVQAQNGLNPMNDKSPYSERPNWLLPNRADFLWDTKTPKDMVKNPNGSYNSSNLDIQRVTNSKGRGFSTKPLSHK